MHTMNPNNHASRQRGPQKPAKTKPDPHALTLTGFSILSRTWSEVKAILSEFSQDEGLIRMALLSGHAIIIDEAADTRLWFTVDDIQIQAMTRNRIPNPTMLQLIGTAQVWSDISAADCEARFRALLTQEN